MAYILDSSWYDYSWNYPTYSLAAKLLREICDAGTTTCKVTLNKPPFSPDKIENVEFYPPAVKMTFKDGTVTTGVARDGDEFNPEIGMMVCIMKYLFKDSNSNYNAMFRKWIKKDKDRKAEIEKEKKVAEEKKAIKARQAEKRRKRKAKKAEEAKQRAIEIQEEAYRQTMDEQQGVKIYNWVDEI